MGSDLFFSIVIPARGKMSIKGVIWGFPGSSVGKKNPPANAGDTRDEGSIPGLGRCPGVGNGNPFQYSCLENPMDRGAQGVYSLRGCRESDVAERLNSDNKPSHCAFF